MDLMAKSPEVDEFFKQASKSPEFLVEYPGRINLIGEHVDYSGGRVLPFAIEQKISLTVSIVAKSESPINADLVVTSADFDRYFTCDKGHFELLNSKLSFVGGDGNDLSHLRGTWAAYVIGALHGVASSANFDSIAPEGYVAVVNITSAIPGGGGLSSSAAFSSGLLKVFTKLTKMEWDEFTIAKEAQKIEHRFIGTNCGLMDQLAVTHCQKNRLLRIDFVD